MDSMDQSKRLARSGDEGHSLTGELNHFTLCSESPLQVWMGFLFGFLVFLLLALLALYI